MSKLTVRELSSVLAALRLLQCELATARGSLPEDVWDIATNGGTHHALTHDEIDALCQRLNCN